MAVLASDDFNRANNADLGANWSVVNSQGPLKIDSNTATATAESTDQSEVYTGASWPADQWSEVVLSGLTGNSRVGPVVRGNTGSQDQILCEAQPTRLDIWVLSSGSWSNVATYNGAIGTTDTIYLEIQGTTVIVRQNGTQRINTTVSGIASGSAGITAYTDSGGGVTNGRINSWQGGDFAAAGTERHQTRRMIQRGGFF